MKNSRFDFSDQSSYQTMSDVLMTMIFVLLLVLMQSKILPNEVVIPEEQVSENTEWRILSFKSRAEAVVLDGVVYDTLNDALQNLASDDYIKVYAADILTGTATLELIQTIQLFGLKNVFLTKREP